MTKGELRHGLRWALTAALILAVAGVAFLIQRRYSAPVSKPVLLDPISDLGYTETTVPSSQSYTFVYVLERSPGALKAVPVYGGAPRAFSFNRETKALHAPGADIPVQTHLVVGYEAPFADFLLDSALLHTEKSSVVLNIRSISLKGRILAGEDEAMSGEQELVDNSRRPLGPVRIQALGEGRVEITWRNQVQELGPGEKWIASEGDPNQSPALGFVNYGNWSLDKVTTLK